ncbi:MAG TPA: HAMP domain-containing protein, partial [Candidatus Limnocylindria bacterium]|nr:HAMP domain-containing protein [Candidatus Limnocylindria bacterium]
MTTLVPRRWMALPRRSARLRLTLLYSGMFLVLGTLVVVVIFLVGSGTASVSRTVVPFPGPAGRAVHTAVSNQHSADVNRLLAGAWVTLVLTAVASAVLGWFVAGRVLRPLRHMTAAARTITAGNLHARLALTGPDDEFKQLGDAFDELLTRLEASFAAQRRFVANAAHELRTPLTVERTLLQVALADPDASASRLRATCGELLASGREQEQLIDALLTLATSERGLETRQPVDLAVAAQVVLESMRSEAERVGVEVTTALGTAGTSGDPTLIERMIVNLLDNAIHYNEPGGRVEVRSATAAAEAVLSVTNTGPWVPPGEIERLF